MVQSVLRWSSPSYLVQPHQEGDVGPGGRSQLPLAGGQAQAQGGAGLTGLPPGGEHAPPSLLAVIGQNLSIPLPERQHQYQL